MRPITVLTGFCFLFLSQTQKKKVPKSSFGRCQVSRDLNRAFTDALKVGKKGHTKRYTFYTSFVRLAYSLRNKKGVRVTLSSAFCLVTYVNRLKEAR